MVSMVLGHGGYGAIAMNTLARGKVDVPLNSFIDLLPLHDERSCSVKVIGAAPPTSAATCRAIQLDWQGFDVSTGTVHESAIARRI